MKNSRTCDIIEGDISAHQKELKTIPVLEMQKYDPIQTGKNFCRTISKLC